MLTLAIQTLVKRWQDGQQGRCDLDQTKMDLFDSKDGDLDGKKFFWISGKLTWNWKIRMFNRKYSTIHFQGVDFQLSCWFMRGYSLCSWKKVGIDFGVVMIMPAARMR